MKRMFFKIATILAVLGVLATALTVGIMHSFSAHASSVYTQACPATLSQGNRNTWVQVLQFDLNALHAEGLVSFAHYPLATDGIFGPNTKGAVVAFQNAYLKVYMKANGVVNATTWGPGLGYCTDSIGYSGWSHTGSKFVSGEHTPGTLSSGKSGVWVQALQRVLNIDANDRYISKGSWWPLKLDGIFGSKTAAAVKALQAANHLRQDGIVGPLTWGAMGMAY